MGREAYSSRVVLICWVGKKKREKESMHNLHFVRFPAAAVGVASALSVLRFLAPVRFLGALLTQLVLDTVHMRSVCPARVVVNYDGGPQKHSIETVKSR